MKVPSNPEEFYRTFGRFNYVDAADGSIIITDRAWMKNITGVQFGPRTVWVHRAVKNDLVDIWHEWVSLLHKYKVIRAEAFCPRHQYWKARYPLSIHSWGAAIDVNPATNMPGKLGDLPEQFVELFTRRGWRWGGNYKSPDGMHFEAYTGKSF